MPIAQNLINEARRMARASFARGAYQTLVQNELYVFFESKGVSRREANDTVNEIIKSESSGAIPAPGGAPGGASGGPTSPSSPSGEHDGDYGAADRQRRIREYAEKEVVRKNAFVKTTNEGGLGDSFKWARVAGGQYKKGKGGLLKSIGERDSAEKQFKQQEELEIRREIQEKQYDLRQDLDNLMKEYAFAPETRRAEIRNEASEIRKQIATLEDEKSKYYSFPGAWRWGGNVLRKPLMGRIANASSSGWNVSMVGRLPPQDRSNLNKARDELKKYADMIVDKTLAEVSSAITKYKNEANAAKKSYEDAKKEATDMLNGKGHTSFVKNLAGSEDKQHSTLMGGMAAAGGGGKDRLIAENLREAYEQLQEVNKRAHEVENVNAEHAGYERVKAMMDQKIGELLKKYRLAESEAAAGILQKERDIILFRFRSRYKNRLIRGFAGLRMIARNAAMGTMTWGDVWYTFWMNIRDFLFGPWIWGSLVVMLEWLLVGSYISPIVPNAFYFVAPLGIAGLTLLLNIEGSMQKPWDMLTHFVSGMMIGFSAVIIAVAVITPEDMAGWDNKEWFQFWFIWGGATMFIGIFSFYQTGGFLFVFQLSVLIMLFGWFALGPYRGVYADIVDQIRALILFVYTSFKDAFTDVWLLATNPQEYFARQQLKNVRAAQGINLPDGVEIESIDLQPLNPALSEKGGVKQSFSASLEIRNKGKADARNVVAWVECDAFCTTATIGNIDYVGWLKDIKNADTRNPNTKISPELIAAAKAVSDNDPKQAEEFLKGSGLIEETVDSPGPFVSAGGATLKAAADVTTEIIKSPQWIGASIDALKEIRDKGSMHAKSQAVGFKVRDAMRPSEAVVQTITNIGSHEISPESKAYLLVSSLKAHVEYDYSASSTLAVKVASNEEYNQVLRDRLLVYVVARGSPTTAQISLSVGRQPLKAGQQYDLVVSVINTRPDGHVYLDSTTPINISIPASMATSLSCLTLDGEYTPATPDTKEGAYKISYAPGANVDIKPSKFSSLFAFTCKFTTPATIDAVKTGLITAKLDTYRFRTTKDINVRYSPPVGVSGLLDKGVVIQDSVTTTLPSASSSPVVIG